MRRKHVIHLQVCYYRHIRGHSHSVASPFRLQLWAELQARHWLSISPASKQAGQRILKSVCNSSKTYVANRISEAHSLRVGIRVEITTSKISWLFYLILFLTFLKKHSHYVWICTQCTSLKLTDFFHFSFKLHISELKNCIPVCVIA